jgi:hypothetical protein
MKSVTVVGRTVASETHIFGVKHSRMSVKAATAARRKSGIGIRSKQCEREYED